MKKILSVFACVLLFLIVTVPITAAVSAIFGYRLTLLMPWVFAIAILVLTAATVMLSIIVKDDVDDRIVSIVFALLTPCALINTAFYVRSCGTLWLVASLLICVGCGYLTFRRGKPLAMRAGSLVLTASLLLPMIFVCFLMLVAGRTQANTVVKTVDSPNGAYYAQVIDNDQGAMGGNTIVNVYPNKGIDTPAFKIQKKHHKVYVGEHDDYKTMDIHWKDNSCLVINSTEYSVK